MKNDTISSIGIMISNKCQLKCKYCYIKNKENIFNESNYEDLFNNFIRNKEKYLEQIIKKFPNAARFEFWGAEPLLYYDEMHDMMKYIIKHSTNNEIEFMVSSNLVYDEDSINDFIGSIVDLIKICEENKKNVKYLLQCSIDFPASRHNLNRKFETQKGSYSIVRNAYEQILSHVAIGNLSTSDYFTFCLTTNSVTNLDDLVPVDTCVSQINEILTNDLSYVKKLTELYDNFQFNFSYFPTIANGIKYNIDNGKKLYYFYKQMFENVEKQSDKINLDVLPYYFTRDFSIYVLDYFNTDKNTSYSCGCFNNYIQIDVDGNILPCHEFLHLSNYNKKDVILGNIFDDDPISNIILIDQIKEYKKKLNDSINLFEKTVFENYKIEFEKLNNRKEYLEAVKMRMFKFYIGRECLASNYMMNNNLTQYSLKYVINSFLPNTILLMEKFIKKHEVALRIAYTQR